MKPQAGEKEISREMTIVNRLGIHARPAALLVKTSNQFKSEIFIEKGNEKVNAKSIMGVMMLAAAMGTKILVSARGDDAEEALEAIQKLLDSKFGED